MLDELRALRIGDYQRSLFVCISTEWNHFLLAVVAATGQGFINRCKHGSAALVIDSDHDTIRIEKIGYRCALRQDLGFDATANEPGAAPLSNSVLCRDSHVRTGTV